MSHAPSRPAPADEATELREKLWLVFQRLAVGFVVFLAGLMVGLLAPKTVAPMFAPLGIQGPAGQLQEQVETLTERNQGLVKERDTLQSKVALIDRDKKEIEQKLQEAEAKIAAYSGS